MSCDLSELRSNLLLSMLSVDDLRKLEPHLESITHPLEDVLYEAGGPIDYVYFPTTCVGSALIIMLDGSAIEVATVGKEGVLGHTVSLHVRTSVYKVIVQVVGRSLRMRARVLEELVENSHGAKELIGRYTAAFMFQISQSVACNGLHQVAKRCCRWLLMTRDRVESPEVPLTHEFLSFMLGVRRSSVSDVLAPLQAAGILRCRRGVITLIDEAAVEAQACECYGQIREEYARLLRAE